MSKVALPIAILLVILYASDGVDGAKLIFAHAICRHGDRNPFSPCKSCPYRSAKHWPGGFGALTKKGWGQHKRLGRWFRRRYRSLLINGNYTPNLVYIKATDTSRTKDSAKACTAGFFPVNYAGGGKYRIEVHFNKRKKETKLLPGKCNRFDYVMLQYMKEKRYKSIRKANIKLIRYLERHSGEKLPTFAKIWRLWDVLNVTRKRGKKLPRWAKKVMQPGGKFEKMAFYWYTLYTRKMLMKKLRAGYLLKEILDRFTGKIKKNLKPNKTIYLYFAHDTTIAQLLDTLGVFKPHVPPYASCLLFELYKTKNGYHMQIIYRRTSKRIYAIKIPRCGTKCGIKKMYSLYKDILPTQSFKQACKLRKGQKLPKGGNPEN